MNAANSPADANRSLRASHAPDARRQIRADPRQYAVDAGLLKAGVDAAEVEVKVVSNRPGVMYVALPPPVAETLGAADLESIQAAGGVSTAGTAGTASTYGCANGTISTASSGGTVGSSGSVDTGSP